MGTDRKSGKKSLWWRSYVTVLDPDDKTRALSNAQFRHWHLLLALYCKNEGVLPDADAIARALLIPRRKVGAVLEGLSEAGLFEEVAPGAWAPHNWDEHQFESDTSKERTRRWRERRAKRHCDVTTTVTGDVTVTASEDRVQRTERSSSGVSADSHSPSALLPPSPPEQTPLLKTAAVTQRRPEPRERRSIATPGDAGFTPEPWPADLPRQPASGMGGDFVRWLEGLTARQHAAYAAWEQRNGARFEQFEEQHRRHVTAEFEALPPAEQVGRLLASHQRAFGREHTPDSGICRQVLRAFDGDVRAVGRWLQELARSRKKPSRSDGWYLTLAASAAEGAVA